MTRMTKSQRLLASIKDLMTSNNLTEVDLSVLDAEQTELAYVIWYDNDATPYDDPVLKVLLDEDSLSLEVDARNFGNTIRLYEDDFAHKVNWLSCIRDNMIEVLEMRELAVPEPLEYKFAELSDREQQWQQDVKAFLIDMLRKHGGRISFVPKNKHEEYPVTATLYGQHDFPRIDISDLYLSDNGERLMADGFEAEEGFREKRRGFHIEPEQLSDALAFISHILQSKTNSTI